MVYKWLTFVYAKPRVTFRSALSHLRSLLRKEEDVGYLVRGPAGLSEAMKGMQYGLKYPNLFAVVVSNLYSYGGDDIFPFDQFSDPFLRFEFHRMEEGTDAEFFFEREFVGDRINVRGKNKEYYGPTSPIRMNAISVVDMDDRWEREFNDRVKLHIDRLRYREFLSHLPPSKKRH